MGHRPPIPPLSIQRFIDGENNMSNSTVHVHVPEDEFVKLVLAIPAPKFPLGQIVMTANAARRLDALAMYEALRRHASGDWGELCAEDARLNELSLAEGDRLLSVYGTGDSRFWIITEADRSVTTILFPEDY
jgi:hypothetical protein